MSGEKDLQILIASMEPRLSPETYGFVSMPRFDQDPAVTAQALMVFEEAEGTTLILPWRLAQVHGAELECGMISLLVHSSLEAVGLTAAFAKALTEVEISANVVAGFYHDHIFVPKDRAEDALDALRTLSEAAR